MLYAITENHRICDNRLSHYSKVLVNNQTGTKAAISGLSP